MQKLSPNTLWEQDEQSDADVPSRVRRTSRLPRRLNQHPKVADLVKRYSDYIPAQGMHDLARTALAPPSESEQEYAGDPPPRPLRDRSRHRLPTRKPSTSDFEHSYAVNVAPRYLAQTRRSLGQTRNTRIPGPIGTSMDSQQSSRRTSPDKRLSRLSAEVKRSDQISPPLSARSSGFPSANGRTTRGKPSSRTNGKEKASTRPPPNSASKPTFRRASNGAPGRVGNIAKHFERLTKETERANRRYAVIRGRRARPVASARAKVEVLDSVQDAIRDESESDSSEADDEGGDEEDARKTTELTATTESSPEVSATLPEQQATDGKVDAVQLTDSPIDGIPTSSEIIAAPQPPIIEETAASPPAADHFQNSINSLPPSPFLHPKASLTPPQSDLDIGSGTERNSIMKALSGFWPQHLAQQSRIRSELDIEDPLSDPEHIFRDSSMVVRTDEPTSIIALALK